MENSEFHILVLVYNGIGYTNADTEKLQNLTLEQQKNKKS